MVGVDLDGLIPPRPAWMADAACREHPDVNFFPTQGEDVEAAKAVCAGCLVREECLAYARAERIPAGIWGGEGTRARRDATTGAPRLNTPRLINPWERGRSRVEAADAGRRARAKRAG